MMRFDYIIVGAGSAGCVLANRLSADASKRVLLLEAGGKDGNPWVHVPVGYFKIMHNPKTDWCYVTEADPGLNGRKIEWPRGKLLGGCSSINGLLYIRGHADDYNTWSDLGNSGWSFQDVLPYFKRSEDQTRGADEYHGAGGELTVSDIRSRRDVCDAFIDGAAELGVPRTDDVNGAKQTGAGYFQTTTKNGRRCSAATAFLRPVKNRANLTIVTNAHVERLLFDESNPTAVVGVQFLEGNTRATAELNPGGEVILSAGAIGSPHILQLSGIGPAAILNQYNIPVVHELHGVGENLQDHLQIRLVHEVNVPTLNDQINNPIRRALIGMKYAFGRRGPMATGASEVCIFCNSLDNGDRPDIQFHIQPLSAEKPGLKMHDFSGVTTSVCQLRPESRGTIQIRSTDPQVYPAIHPNYLSTLGDQETAVASMRYARRLAGTDALSKFIVKEHAPGSGSETDDALLDAARQLSQTIYHPVGTCKMGQDQNAVVDAELRVHGVSGLRVVDASIMPTIVSGNTNAPTIMIAEKASDLILGKAAKPVEAAQTELPIPMPTEEREAVSVPSLHGS